MRTSVRAICEAAKRIVDGSLCSSPDPGVTFYAWMNQHFIMHIKILIEKSNQAKNGKVRSKVKHLARVSADFLKVFAAFQCGDNVCHCLGKLRHIARKIGKICLEVRATLHNVDKDAEEFIQWIHFEQQQQLLSTAEPKSIKNLNSSTSSRIQEGQARASSAGLVAQVSRLKYQTEKC